MHGMEDRIVPWEHSQKIHHAAPRTSSFVPLPGVGHFTIWVDMGSVVEQHSIEWFDRHLAH